MVETTPEVVREVEQEIQAAAQDSSRATSEIVDRTMQVAADQGRATPNLLDHALQYVQAVARSNRILARGVGMIALEWFGLRQERLLRNLNAVNDLLACRSMPDLVSLQSALMRQNVEQMIGSSQRLGQISAQVAQEATQMIMASGTERHTF